MAWQLRKKHLLPLAAGLSLSLSAASVLAEDSLDFAPVQPVSAGGAAPKKDEDSKSFLREHLWEGSFDKAGDASRDAEVALKKQTWQGACSQADDKSLPAAQAQAARARCDALAKEMSQYGGEAESIRSTQRIFSDVSKASDLAAVGAIGATAYAQLGKRNPSQASSLESVAKIQETAGYVSYASGAADFSMGAYAYLAQKSKFEEMEEKLKKANASKALVSKVSAAAEATKQAAYNHMMYGAGKAAFGYASMYMAKQNRKQAENLTSLTPETVVAAPAVSVATPTISGGVEGGSGLTYNNNQPVFSVGDGTSLSTATAASTSTTPVFSSSGGSVMRASETRSLSSSSGGSFSPGGSGTPGGGGGGGGNGAALEAVAEEGEATGAAAEKGGTYEINTLGGSPHYAGGSSKSSSSDEAGAISSLLTSALGGSPDSAGTGVNPNQIYREATTDESGAEVQGNEAGVSSANRSLFEVMRSKYAKIIQGGRVMGPGAVEVRN